MTDTPKKPTDGRKQKLKTSKVEESKVEKSEVEKPAASPEPETAVPVETETLEVSPEVTPPAKTSGRTAHSWLSVSKIHLGVKPWIVRAAVAGHDSERKYTEDEIRSLIRRKLSEPA